MKFITTISYALISLILAQISILDSTNCQRQQPFDYPTAALSTKWNNNVSAPHSVTFTDGSTIRSILLNGVFGPRYACGFYCNGACENYLFAVFIVQTNSGGGIVQPAIGFPQVVWSANRDRLVGINSSLELTSDGDLVLKDFDGVPVWSSKTSGKNVVGISLNDVGNLVLFDSENKTIWQSFDHPTDALVPGQRLFSTQSLTSSISATNWTRGLYSLQVSSNGLKAGIKADPPQTYYQFTTTGNKTNSPRPSYIKFMNGSLDMFILDEEPNSPDHKLPIPEASSAQYMKLESDGHLRVYEWGKGDRSGWGLVADLLTGHLGICNYPTVCGQYGICSNGQCTCPAVVKNRTNHFELINDRQPNLGCREIVPLRCDASKDHELLELKDISYFSFESDIVNTNMKNCKEVCLRKCSCKAAFFRYGADSRVGNCYLPSRIYSMMINDEKLTHYNSTGFIKVQRKVV